MLENTKGYDYDKRQSRVPGVRIKEPDLRPGERRNCVKKQQALTPCRFDYDLRQVIIRPDLDTLDKARTLWQKELTNLPMDEEHKQALREHWQNLQSDFRI